MKRYYLLPFLFFTCQEVEEIIEIEIGENIENIVVEGWVTDIHGQQSIKISRSNGFTSEKPIASINDARVEVFDQLGSIFSYSPNEDGLYTSDSSFAGAGMDGVREWPR